jgi:hypothetical protein
MPISSLPTNSSLQNINFKMAAISKWPPFKNGHHFKMAANIKIKKIVKNSKMKRFQWKWIFIPILLAYVVPLNVDVVPIKFHQFLFGR